MIVGLHDAITVADLSLGRFRRITPAGRTRVRLVLEEGGTPPPRPISAGARGISWIIELKLHVQS
jgi:hypothetical protein